MKILNDVAICYTGLRGASKPMYLLYQKYAIFVNLSISCFYNKSKNAYTIEQWITQHSA